MATVFIADDSHLIQKRLINVLSDLEKIHVVGEAENGTEAIRRIRELKPEVVILDVCMAPGAGLDVLRSIKGDKSAPIVIMYTNHPFPQFRKKCIEYGADFFFDKTHEFTKLFLTLENLSQSQTVCE
ncbi:response regulator [candidate division KSB1 bacterium]|nr:response regulator [candidate division KSB1 bacterium]NIR68876.1 response regulator [candidate division KSB1 bacterium]NIS27244.1 response regulator [candidate division KSB1 bacterium]NIT74129.1 response regulator [candidate division KSB1 bacterium]NIU27978.1 response regulator [candidate division KSB1 bacterium]